MCRPCFSRCSKSTFVSLQRSRQTSSPKVTKEWQRILARLRRNGPTQTSEYVAGLIQPGNYPLGVGVRLMERLMRSGEYDAAGRIIEAVDFANQQHPLVDELHAAWLWCTGRKREAISFAKRTAKRWMRSYLFRQLGAFYDLDGDKKKASRCFQIAGALELRQEKNWIPAVCL